MWLGILKKIFLKMLNILEISKIKPFVNFPLYSIYGYCYCYVQRKVSSYVIVKKQV